MIKTKCSKCKKIIENNDDDMVNDVFQDYDHEYYCEKCYLKKKLIDATQEYNEKKQWLENTHLKHLEKLRKKMDVLKTEINKL